MKAYPKAYLNDVVKNQGKLFDKVVQVYPNNNTKDFINAYAESARVCIDDGTE